MKEQVIQVKTGPAIKNVADLKDNIVALKQQLATLDIGTKEYQDTLVQLQDNQAALRNAMHATTGSMEELMAAAQGANIAFDDQNKLVDAEAVSYNALTRQLGKLRDEWKSTTDSAERANIAERMNAVNDQLKAMDATVGNYQRNVGNYNGAVDHLLNSLGGLGGAAGKAVAPIKGVKTGLDMLGKTPVIAILGLLVGILDKVMQAMKGSEENTQALTAAMSPLQAIGDLVTKMFEGLGKAVVWVVEKFTALTSAIFKNNEAMSERKRLAQEEIELTHQQRDNLIENAKAERDIAELRAKASQKDIYTAKERLAFLEEAGEREAEIAKRAADEARRQYEIIRDRNKLTQSSTQALDEEARAQAAMIKAETDYYKALRTINAGITQARRQEAKDARDAAKAVKDAAQAKAQAEADYLRALLQVTRDGSEEQLAIQNDIAARERDKAKADARQKITDAKDLAKALQLIDMEYALATERNAQDHANKLTAEELRAVANRRDALERGSVEYLQASAQYAKAALDAMTQQMDETDQAFEARLLAGERALAEAELALRDKVEAQDRAILEARLSTLEEGSPEYLAAALELKAYELDTLHRLEGESEDEFRARQAKADKEYLKAKREQFKATLDIMQQAAGSATSILGSLADIMEADSDMSERQAKAAKNIRIAAATIDMLQGAVTAYAAAQSLGVPLGPIIGAANAAAVIAAGTANIAKMRATAVSKSAGGSSAGDAVVPTPAVVSAPAYVPGVAETAIMTGARGEDRLNRMASTQRVYILASDLEAERHASRVQVAETTF